MSDLKEDIRSTIMSSKREWTLFVNGDPGASVMIAGDVIAIKEKIGIDDDKVALMVLSKFFSEEEF